MSAANETAFTWIIKDFDVLPHSSGEKLASPAFSVDVLKKTKFTLNLYPRGYKDENYVSLYLKRHSDDGGNKMYFEYELCLVDASGNCTNSQKSAQAFCENTSWGYLKFYERNLLLRSLRHNVLPDNKLTVRCRIVMLDQDEGRITLPYPCDLEIYQALSRDFGGLLTSEIHSDLTILVDRKEFKVHRAILENRCPNLLKKLVKLKDLNAYSLPSIEAPVLMTVLKYLYTGVCRDSEFDVELLEKVFIATNTYELSELKTSLFPKPTCITAVTETSAFRAISKWVIQDFKASQLSKTCICRLLSDEMPDWSWVKISLRKIQTISRRSYELNFQRVCEREIIFIRCEINVVDRRGALHILKECEHIFANQDEWTTPIDFNTNWMDEMLQNGDLWLQVKIHTAINRHHSETREMVFDTVFQGGGDGIKQSVTFQRDLKNLYENMKYADVILRVGDEQLPAHKAVLCCRSEVFLKMFLYDTLEKQKDIVNIEDIDVPTMKAILIYMYYGDIGVHLSVDNAMEMYAASDKYQLFALKEKCSRYLKSYINADNVGDILILADAHYDESLKKHALNFITSNPREVLNSERGLNVLVNRVHLYQEVLSSFLPMIEQVNDAKEKK